MRQLAVGPEPREAGVLAGEDPLDAGQRPGDVATVALGGGDQLDPGPHGHERVTDRLHGHPQHGCVPHEMAVGADGAAAVTYVIGPPLVEAEVDPS